MTIKNINNIIPNEILTYIFTFLNAKDLTKCSLICKLWNEVAGSNSLWKPLFQKNISKHLVISQETNWKNMYISHISKKHVFSKLVVAKKSSVSFLEFLPGCLIGLVTCLAIGIIQKSVDTLIFNTMTCLNISESISETISTFSTQFATSLFGLTLFAQAVYISAASFSFGGHGIGFDTHSIGLGIIFSTFSLALVFGSSKNVIAIALVIFAALTLMFLTSRRS